MMTFTRGDVPPAYEFKPGPNDPDHIGYYELIYGVWEMEDGRQIAFNRHYKALWLRSGKKITRLKQKHVSELFPGVAYRERWLWDDGCAPHLTAKCWQRSERNLLRFLTGRSVAEWNRE
jgi:hypothetical protein